MSCESSITPHLSANRNARCCLLLFVTVRARNLGHQVTVGTKKHGSKACLDATCWPVLKFGSQSVFCADRPENVSMKFELFSLAFLFEGKQFPYEQNNNKSL
jgi:hypothetical protein